MAFLGMRGTGDWATDERPKNWREGILRLYPNGDAPLTAIMSKMGSQSTDDPEFNWWTKSLATQAAAVTSVYTDAGLTTEYTTGGAAAATLYVRMAAAAITQFRAGHQVLLRNTANYADDTNAKVTAVTIDGADSYLTVTLLQADPTTTGIADCDRVLIIGNINAEGGLMPDVVAYDPTKHYNYTQIWRTPLSITRTARKTKLRTANSYKESKREALELHSIEMEKSYIWGIATENTGSNGKPERTTGGIIEFIKNNSGIVEDYSLLASEFNNTTWANGGEDWLDSVCERIFRYGKGDTRLAFIGSLGLRAINKLVKDSGTFEFKPTTTSYGIRVIEWVTPFGTIYLKRHPLFSYEVTNARSMLVVDPADIKFRYVDDTSFYAEGEKQNTGAGRKDATDEEYLTEGGLEMHFPQKCAYVNGIGVDNVVGA